MLIALRFLAFGIIFIPVALVATVLCLLRPFNTKNIAFFCRALSFFVNHIFNFKVELSGAENLTLFRPCIFVVNHQSNYDFFVGINMIPLNTVVLGKKSLLYIPFFGIFFWLSGNILIKR